MGFITADRDQSSIIAFNTGDLVPTKAKCRFIADFVKRLDLKKLYCRYSDQGGDAYDPSIMLSIWFLSYSEGIQSSRKLQERCERDTHYMYLSANLRPDHCALSRFRQRNIDLMEGFFVELVKMLVESGISKFERVGIDGTKVQAVSSLKGSKNSDSLNKYIKAVQQDIAKYMDECNEADQREGTNEEIKAN